MTSPTKTCCACKQDKPLDDFAMKIPARNIRQSRCRECQRIISRAHYEANREKVIERSAANRATQQGALRKFVKAELSGKSCCRCGATRSLTFKVDPGYDGPRVSAAMNFGMALDTVKASIANSTIVCKKCDHLAGAEGLLLSMEAKRKGEKYEGSPLTRAEQKDRNTRVATDLRKGRFENGRLPGACEST